MMNNDKKPNPEETAKRLQSMVSLGIPESNFTGRNNSTQPPPTNPVPETEHTTGKEETQPQQDAETLPAVVSARTGETVTHRRNVTQTQPVRRGRREQPENYGETYFRRVDFTDRQPLYITRSTHEKLMMIVNIIGGRKATISSYVENILLQHLDSHREEINRLFDEYYISPVQDKETNSR